MDIYILHDRKESGPFTAEAARALVGQGSVLLDDLAWRRHMPKWLPLAEILSATEEPHPLPAAVEDPLPAPDLVASPVDPTVYEPATARQKALLSYLGLAFTDELNRTTAALLMDNAMEHPHHSERFEQWMRDRLRQHPDLFAAEIRARKEQRADRLLRQCQERGAEYFSQTTKAHVQVLLNFLDVKFPNWDAHEDSAIHDYFFPAMAEKFPQLVRRLWKGRLKYPSSSKIVRGRSSAELWWHRAPAFGFAAVARGVLLGLLLLAALGIVRMVVKDGSPTKSSTTVKHRLIAPATAAEEEEEPETAIPTP